MAEIAREAGIAYGTLVVFLKKYRDRIPSEKQGRFRVFPREAVDVIKEIVRENAARQGRKVRARTEDNSPPPAKTSLHPPESVRSLKRLPAHGLFFRNSIDVLIEPEGDGFIARTVELNFSAGGRTGREAMDKLRIVIAETYLALIETDIGQWTRELSERAGLVGMIKRGK